MGAGPWGGARPCPAPQRGRGWCGGAFPPDHSGVQSGSRPAAHRAAPVQPRARQHVVHPRGRGLRLPCPQPALRRVFHHRQREPRTWAGGRPLTRDPKHPAPPGASRAPAGLPRAHPGVWRPRGPAGQWELRQPQRLLLRSGASASRGVPGAGAGSCEDGTLTKRGTGCPFPTPGQRSKVRSGSPASPASRAPHPVS